MQISISECVCGSIFIYLFLSVSTSLSVSLSSICSISMWWASKNGSELSLFPIDFPVIKIVIAYLKCMSWEKHIPCHLCSIAICSFWLIKKCQFRSVPCRKLTLIPPASDFGMHIWWPNWRYIYKNWHAKKLFTFDSRNGIGCQANNLAGECNFGKKSAFAPETDRKKRHGSVAVGNHHWPDINENNWLVLLIWRNMFWQKKYY